MDENLRDHNNARVRMQQSVKPVDREGICLVKVQFFCCKRLLIINWKNCYWIQYYSYWSEWTFYSLWIVFLKDKKCVVIYEITCDQDPAHQCTRVHLGETKRPLGKRFKVQHTNLTLPTGVGDHCNATGHSVSLNNTKVLTREPQWTKRKVKEAIYIMKNAPSMNREQGYQLPPIYHQLLLPEQFPRRKTSHNQDFSLRSRNVVTVSKTRSKVGKTLFIMYSKLFYPERCLHPECLKCIYIIIIIIKSLFQAMPIKVRCTMYNSSNGNPNIGCSSTRTHYYKIKNTHRCCKKPTYVNINI